MTTRLRYSYHMQLTFEQPVNRHHFKLRCFPSDDGRQKISDEHIEIYPVHFSSNITDSFGNRCIYGTAEQSHDHFAVDVTGLAGIDSSGRLEAESHKAEIFRYSTELTHAGKTIREFHRSLEPMNWMNDYERAVYMMNRL